MENVSNSALDRPLPADVVVAGNSVWSRYRRYPVFSRAWLAGRMRVFTLVVAVAALVIGGGNGLEHRDYALGMLGGLYLFGSFVAMAGMGPALATWVRQRGWPLPRERRGVVAAIVLGMALSAGIDAWASSQLEDLFQLSVRYGQTPVARTPPQGLEKAVALAVNGVVLLVIYGLLGGGLALRTYFGEQRRLAASRQRAELDALRLRERETGQRLALLQAQVEPHFLFNSLASIRALVATSPARAEAALDALVAYLRSTIPQWRDGDAVASTLGQQLDICAAYLELMQARMGERLSFAVVATAELRALPFPPLLLIGLVENAIKHGVEPQSGPGHVRVEALSREDQLLVQVGDDGVGIRAGVGSGLGLANLREQLELRYGGKAGFSLVGRRERGALAEIRLPLARVA